MTAGRQTYREQGYSFRWDVTVIWVKENEGKNKGSDSKESVRKWSQQDLVSNYMGKKENWSGKDGKEPKINESKI